MCGIFFTIGSKDTSDIFRSFKTLEPRGPDNSTFLTLPPGICMGFHRLMINDLTPEGNQPLYSGGVYLICNGEIYNHNELRERYSLSCKSRSDCEVVLHLYKKLRSERFTEDAVTTLCNELDGEYAFVICDLENRQIVAARDPAGVRPLFIGIADANDDNTTLAFASELRALDGLFDPEKGYINQVMPTNAVCVNIDLLTTHGLRRAASFFDYTSPPLLSDATVLFEHSGLEKLRALVERAVLKRIESERPVCALLSGGLDSSLVCGILARHIPLHTFSVGLKGSTDLAYAQEVADHIKSTHHSVLVTEADMLGAIEETIRVTESYDITTIRASVGNLLVAQYISKNTDFKVVFTGEFSDELFASYLYFARAPDPGALFEESLSLLRNIRFFDSLRADRCISSCGLEARVPFSDKELANFVHSIDPKVRMSNNKMEKYILRKAFEGTNVIPDAVLWRRKEAFSDGVSSPQQSFHRLIQSHIDKLVPDKEFEEYAPLFRHNTPRTKEAYYYRKVFSKHFHHPYVIPYFWLPKWCGETSDPSARELEHYVQTPN